MNINDISTQLLYTTVPIYAEKKDHQISSGTGFIFSIQETDNASIPLLITNYHVLEDAIAGFIEFHIGEKGLPTKKTIKIQFDNSIVNSNKLGSLDLIAIPLASTLNNLQNRNVEIFYRSVDSKMIPSLEQRDDFGAIEDITFIGYPSGLYDNENKTPLIRQGITATPIWNKFKGEDVFLVDAGVFPGSSGSPVFIFNQGAYPTSNGISIGNRLFFVGIISQTILRDENTHKNFLNLGKVINSISFDKEINIFISNLKKMQNN